MRIAQLTYSTKPRGGVVHTLALAEALAARGHEVTVWTLGRDGDDAFFRQVDPAVRLRVVPFPSIEGEEVGDRIQRSIEVMAQALRAELNGGHEGAARYDGVGYDIVHAQDCISANAVALTGFTSGLRTIHHLDEFTTPRLVECHDAAVVEPRARLCVSAAVAAEVEQKYGVRPTVIPNGVDARRFAAAAGPEGEAARQRWREWLGDYVLALGGIEPRKGSIDLLEAFALLREDRPGLRLVFGGGETLFDYRPYRERFDQRAAELGVEPVVLGTLDEEELPALVAAARVLGFASVKEGFGLAAMEALAAGTAVVARDLPVTREVFGDTVRYARDVPGFAAALGQALEEQEVVGVPERPGGSGRPGGPERSAGPGRLKGPDRRGMPGRSGGSDRPERSRPGGSDRAGVPVRPHGPERLHGPGRPESSRPGSRAEAGRALAARYTWEAAAARHETFYTEVLRRGGDHGQALDLTDHRPTGR